MATVGIRVAMEAACEQRTVAYTRECSGRVRLTVEQLVAVQGDDFDGAKRDDILAEARIGCCQRCGCLNAAAWFEVVDDVVYVVARCRKRPGELALGDRVEPDPGKLP